MKKVIVTLALLLLGLEVFVRVATPDPSVWDDSAKLQIARSTSSSSLKTDLIVNSQSGLFYDGLLFDDLIDERLERLFELSGNKLNISSKQLSSLEESSCEADILCIVYVSASLDHFSFNEIEEKPSSFLKSYDIVRGVLSRAKKRITNINEIKRNYSQMVSRLSFGRDPSNIIVVIVPDLRFLSGDYPLKEEHSILSGTLSSKGYKVLDTLNIFEGVPSDRLVAKPRENFSLNEIGVRVLAEQTYQFLRSEKVLADQYFAAKVLVNRIGVNFKDNQQPLKLK
jgi:hypothetical protein